MSIFNNIKRSLGFGSDVNDPDDDLLADSVDSNESDSFATPAPIPAPTVTVRHTAVVDTTMVDRIFDHVVATFNEALPGFLSHSVDAEAQSKKLYDSLDSSIKEYLKNVAESAKRNCEEQWAEEQAVLRNEMECLRSKTKEIEQQRFDIKQQQLSADRQRRALNDRVHDLESQLAAFDAEREQLDLENKSLLNKLKVMSVHESDIDDLRAELEHARVELLNLRNQSVAGESAPDSGVDKAVLEELNARIDSLSEENTRLNAALENAAEKDRIATEMLNGLQSKASSARNELAQKESEIAELKEKLDDARVFKDEIDRINSQMTLVEQAIEKRDRKISRLKTECEELRKQNEGLQKHLAEIEGKDVVAQPNFDVSPDEDARSPKISDSDLAAIEESFDSNEWMSSEPAETPSMRAGITDADFGYQPPVRKNSRHDNDAQLSLF